MPRVFNRRHKDIPPDAVYVGRGSPWGNPYKVGIASVEYTRKDSIRLFEEYARMRLKKDPGWLEPLVGRDLVCWCKPKACHADVLVKLIEETHV